MRTCSIAAWALLLVMWSHPAAAVTVAWSPSGDLGTARYAQVDVLLPSGQVLAVAGDSANPSGPGNLALTSCELFDPATGGWSPTGALSDPRFAHTATLLLDGTVLAAGGSNHAVMLSSAELYEPALGTWSPTGSLSTPRWGHTATLLQNGTVLVVGGSDGATYLNSCEIYDPVATAWTVTGSLATARQAHGAVLLPSGKVLVVGGTGASGAIATCELYDPASGLWSATGSLATARMDGTATLIGAGPVLAAGGFTTAGAELASCELYDLASGSWSAAGSLGTARAQHTATLLGSGAVVAVGGNVSGSPQDTASCEAYDPVANAWSAVGSLGTARTQQAATLLPSGQLLVAGGIDWPVLLASSEISVDPRVPLITSPTSVAADTYDAFCVSSSPPATARPPSALAAGSLPAGLGLNAASGLISGTPTAPGVSTVSVAAANGTGGGPPLPLTITILAVPAITSAATATGTLGSSFAYQIVATYAPTSYAVVAGSLPLGMALNGATGAISGTPQLVGVTAVSLTASNANGASAAFTLTIAIHYPGAAQPANLASQARANMVLLSWSREPQMSFAVFRRAPAAPPFVPVNATSYVAGQSYGAAICVATPVIANCIDSAVAAQTGYAYDVYACAPSTLSYTAAATILVTTPAISAPHLTSAAPGLQPPLSGANLTITGTGIVPVNAFWPAGTTRWSAPTPSSSRTPR